MKPTLLITFDAPELETSLSESHLSGYSVFELLGFTGKANLYSEAIQLLKRARPDTLLDFSIFSFYCLYTKVKRLFTIFDLLKSFDVKATFFGIAANIDPARSTLNELYYNPEIYKKILESGHELGLHGYLHRVPTASDIAISKTIMRKVLGITPRTYSTPYGKDDIRLRKILRDEGFIGWRTWRFDNDFIEKPYMVHYVADWSHIDLDKIVKQKEVLAINCHVYSIFPRFGRFKVMLKGIKQRKIWTPTFSDFCDSLESEYVLNSNRR